MDTAHTTFIKKANGDIEERSQNKIFTSTELYTRDYLAARLEEAADTLKRLPRAIARPCGVGTQNFPGWVKAKSSSTS